MLIVKVVLYAFHASMNIIPNEGGGDDCDFHHHGTNPNEGGVD